MQLQEIRQEARCIRPTEERCRIGCDASGRQRARIPALNWEKAKQMTRGMIADFVQEKRGTDFWVMPSYRSRDAFLKDQRVKIAATDRKSRRAALALLIGQHMTVPDDADPKIALGLAVDL